MFFRTMGLEGDQKDDIRAEATLSIRRGCPLFAHKPNTRNIYKKAENRSRDLVFNLATLLIQRPF